MPTLCLVTQQLPMADDPLPAPMVVATITTDRRLLGHLSPSRLLSNIAAKAGLMQFSIVDGEAQDVPGYQFDLFQR